jgi:ATP-dependent Clp protease protease subunit
MNKPSAELLKERCISICGPITDANTTDCMAQLLYLSSADANRPITLSVDSPGGLVTASLAILDTLDEIPCAVHTFCAGHAGGTAAAIVAHGSRGFRTASATATFSFAPISDGSQGKVLLETEIAHLERVFVEILKEDTSKHEHEIRSLFSRHAVFTASEAVACGLIDAIQPAAPIPSPTQQTGGRLWRIVNSVVAALRPRL